MGLNIRQEEIGAVRLLMLEGRLDTETAADFELALQDLRNAGEHDFLIDLTGIGYVSSAGLRVLLSLAKQLDGGNGSVRLCGLSPAVREVFDVAGFSKLFAIFPNRNAALGDLPQPEPAAVMARKAAQLLGVRASAKPSAQAAQIARAAALLLGIRPTAAAGKSAPSLRTPAVPPSALERQRSAQQTQAKPVGFVARLRKLFGAKP